MQGRAVGPHPLRTHPGTYDPIGQLGLHSLSPPTAERTLQARFSFALGLTLSPK